MKCSKNYTLLLLVVIVSLVMHHTSGSNNVHTFKDLKGKKTTSFPTSPFSGNNRPSALGKMLGAGNNTELPLTNLPEPIKYASWWEITGNKMLQPTLPSRSQSHVSLSSTGKRIAISPSYENSVHIFDIAQQKKIDSFVKLPQPVVATIFGKNDAEPTIIIMRNQKSLGETELDIVGKDRLTVKNPPARVTIKDESTIEIIYTNNDKITYTETNDQTFIEKERTKTFEQEFSALDHKSDSRLSGKFGPYSVVAHSDNGQFYAILSEYRLPFTTKYLLSIEVFQVKAHITQEQLKLLKKIKRNRAKGTKTIFNKKRQEKLSFDNLPWPLKEHCLPTATELFVEKYKPSVQTAAIMLAVGASLWGMYHLAPALPRMISFFFTSRLISPPLQNNYQLIQPTLVPLTIAQFFNRTNPTFLS